MKCYISNRKEAWLIFLNQWLIPHGAGKDGDGEGYLEYRRILKEEGLAEVFNQWRLFITEKCLNESITNEQYETWWYFPPPKIRNLIHIRRYRGEPTGKPRGNPAMKLQKKGGGWRQVGDWSRNPHPPERKRQIKKKEL